MSENRIRETRLKKGMTMTELSIKSGVHLSGLSMIERGQKCTKQTADKLCEVLCADPLKMFPDYNNMVDLHKGNFDD